MVPTNNLSVDPPFPWLTMASLSVGMLAHSVVFTAPMPFVAFMIVDFGMSSNLDSAGYWAGWITGTFMIGRIFSGIPWGIASDKWGRKPCLLLSMFNIALLGIMFGLSTSFHMAVITRLMIGLGNGFMGVAKVCVTELVHTKEHELRGFGMINGVWGFGLVVGPAVGGVLSRPAIQYPHLHIFTHNPLWISYPYLLPCIICSSIAIIGMIMMYCFLPETLRVGEGGHDYHSVKLSSTETTGMDNIDDDAETVISTIEDEETICNTSDTHHHYEEKIVTSLNKQKTLSRNILQDKSIHILLVIVVAFYFTITFMDESMPLWAVTTAAEGGLAFTSAQTGMLLASVGIGLVIFQLFFYEDMMRRYFNHHHEHEIIYRLAVIAAIGLILVPISSTLATSITHTTSYHIPSYLHQVIVRVAVLVMQLIYHCPATSIFTSLSVVVNRSVSREMRGTMNGLVMTVASLGNALGPIIGSMIYATLIDSPKPIDGRWIFGIAAMFMLAHGFACKRYLRFM